jgi:Tfp pilus assembly protein PilV
LVDQNRGPVRLKDPDKRPWRSRLREQRGSMLVEVMVGAVVLAIATTALLNGIDGAQSQGTTNKARSTASALAEQDQERLRALPVASLATCCTPASRTVTVRGVNYTVTSSVAWVTDQGGPISCSNDTKTAANLKITSAVTSNATKGVVDEVGLVTPPPGTFSPGQGRAIVKVNNADGSARVGANVSLIGATTYTGVTNSLGCAIFPFVDVGTYTASVGAGQTLVDWQGTNPSTQGLTVTEATSTTASLEMDTAATINAIFDTVVNGTTVTNQKSQWITLMNGHLTVGKRIFDAGSAQTTVSAGNLFPFTDPYTGYAGQCTVNNPTTPPNTGTLGSWTVTPGQNLTLGAANDIRLPAINVKVVSATSGTAINAATVKVYTADTGCTNVFPSQTTNTSGLLPLPGYPYGKYTICAQSGTRRGFADVYPYSSNTTPPTSSETVTNYVPGGSGTTYNAATHVRIWISSTLSPTGTCP